MEKYNDQQPSLVLISDRNYKIYIEQVIVSLLPSHVHMFKKSRVTHVQ